MLVLQPTVTSSNLRSAVTCQILLSFPFVCGMEVHICLWSSLCGHLSDARKNEGWFFPKAPHRVQSHYRPCKIQLVTEFAAQERGEERQDGEGWGMSIKWISWWENSRGHMLIVKEKEGKKKGLFFFTLKCTSKFAEDGQFYLLEWTMIKLAYFGESTEVKSFSLNERLDFRKNSPGRQSFLFHIWLS